VNEYGKEIRYACHCALYRRVFILIEFGLTGVTDAECRVASYEFSTGYTFCLNTAIRLPLKMGLMYC
jgi:hypothetical protein